MLNEKQAQRKTNRLIHEKSPYLLQHAYNPVDWFPWGEEAFEKARTENKPIFLSIGYSTCHWCHVMEKECFEDEEVAKLMNDNFVSIKVDREERPDLDATYMAVCQAMGRSCGWPLNILLTPQLNAFFATSYIPKTSMRGQTGMMELVPQVADIWRLRRKELEIVGADIKSRIEAQEKRTPENMLGKEILDEAYEMLHRNFDEENGGFGRAPKFPRAHSLLFLLRYWNRTGEKNALSMVDKTLTKMRLGGIFDQIGFGFHRYSTDSVWLVPHFEKMLYDQAMLSLAYIEAYQATKEEKFKTAAKETLSYTLRELSSPEGVFCSAEDADSEGEEGKFYIWTMQEIVDVLAPADADLATHIFGLDVEGNYIDSLTGRRNGKNILYLSSPLEEIASYKGTTLDDLVLRLERIRNTLFEIRMKRVPPAKDDKVLTDWNGLTIAAMARASIVFDEPKYLQIAEKGAEFFTNHMRDQDGSLFHRSAKGEKAIEGFLDDYAFLAFGLTELFEATLDKNYLRIAVDITKTMIGKFWDEKSGGFYFSTVAGAGGIPKLKQVYDGALPSGNSFAALNLIRLSRLTADSSYEEMAIKLIKAFSQEVQGMAEAYTFLLETVDYLVGPSQSVIVVGKTKAKDTIEMLNAIRKPYMPNLTYELRDPDNAGIGYEIIEGKTTAYVCRGQMCLPPTNNIETMLKQLSLS